MSRSLASRGLSAFLLLFPTSLPAFAQTTTYTWTGGDFDDFWFSPLNWSAVGPGSPPPLNNLNDTILVLTGTARTTNVLDYSFSAKSLTINASAGAFSVSTTTNETLTLGTGGLTIASGNANNQTFNANLAQGAAGAFANNGNRSFSVGGAVDNGGFLLTLGGTGNSTYSGVTSGSGGLTKTGAGTVILSGANTFTGLVTINGGVLQVPRVLSNTAGAADCLGTVPASPVANAITIANGAILRNTNTGTVGSSFVTANRGITIGAGGGVFDLPDTAAGTFLVYNGIVAQGSNALTKTGPAILALMGTTTGTGALNINQGTVRLRISSDRISNSSPVTIASGANLDMATFSDTIGSLAGAGNVTFGSGTGTLTGGSNNTSTTFSGVISGSGGFTKAGTGTQTFAGTNTYTGATIVSAGTLAVGTGGSLAAGSAVAVNSGGVLAGTGTVNGAVTVNAGGAIRGDGTGGTGTLAVNNDVAINSTASLGGILRFEASRTGAGAANASLIALSGASSTLNLNPGAGQPLVIDLVNGTSPLQGGESYTLTLATVATTGNIQLNGVSLSANTTIAASNYTLQSSSFDFFTNVSLTVDSTGTELVLTLTPVPEPTTVLALAAGTLMVAGPIRRRRCALGRDFRPQSKGVSVGGRPARQTAFFTVDSDCIWPREPCR